MTNHSQFEHACYIIVNLGGNGPVHIFTHPQIILLDKKYLVHTVHIILFFLHFA